MKWIFTILTFFTLSVSAQDTLYWIGSGHPLYNVEQSPDNITWKTFSQVPGTADSNYVAAIPLSSYYYRVTADGDTSNCILVYNPLLIVPDSVFHPLPKKEKFSMKVAGHRVIIESDADKIGQLSLCNISGQTLSTAQVFLHRGTNNYYLKAPASAGVYILNIETSREAISKEILY